MVPSVSLKIIQVGEFRYADLGAGVHYIPQHRLWISHHFKLEGEYLPLPVKGQIFSGKSTRTLILRPGDFFVFVVEQDPGFRGSAKIELISPEGANLYKFPLYKSPRGNLGIGEGALVQTSSFPVLFRVSRTGRLYGAPPTTYCAVIYSPEREFYPLRVEEFEEDPRVLGLLLQQ